MARPIDPTAQYRVSIHNIGGYRYASTQPAYQDPETGKTAFCGARRPQLRSENGRRAEAERPACGANGRLGSGRNDHSEMLGCSLQQRVGGNFVVVDHGSPAFRLSL